MAYLGFDTHESSAGTEQTETMVVPSGATFVVVTFVGYNTSPDMWPLTTGTFGGETLIDRTGAAYNGSGVYDGVAGNSGHVAIMTAAGTFSTSEDLVWDTAAAPSDGVHVTCLFFSDIDAYVDEQTSAADAATVTGLTGSDWLVGVGYAYNQEPDCSGSGQTEVDAGNFTNAGYCTGYIASGTSFTITNDSYSVVAAITFSASGGGSDTSIAVSENTRALLGYAPALDSALGAATTNARALLGYAPTLDIAIAAAATNARALLGYVPTLDLTNLLVIEVGVNARALLGYAPTAEFSYVVSAGVNTRALLGYAPTLVATVSAVLTAANSRELRDELGVVVASLSNIVWEWYDTPGDTTGEPIDSGTFNTDSNGEASFVITGTSLTDGQFGQLILYHPTDPAIRGTYRVPVST